VSPANRWCRGCRFYDEEQLEERLKGEHDLVKAHLEAGNWHPKGKQFAGGSLGWCEKQGFATEARAISCEFWADKRVEE